MTINYKAAAFVGGAVALSFFGTIVGAGLPKEARIKGEWNGRKIDIPVWQQEFYPNIKNAKVSGSWAGLAIFLYVVSAIAAILAAVICREEYAQLIAERNLKRIERKAAEGRVLLIENSKLEALDTALKLDNKFEAARMEVGYEEMADEIGAGKVGTIAPPQQTEPPKLKEKPKTDDDDIDSLFDKSEAKPVKQPIEKDTAPVFAAIANSKRSLLIVGDTGAGKSFFEARLIHDLLKVSPDTEFIIVSQKNDDFCGLNDKGCVNLFKLLNPEIVLDAIDRAWQLYRKRADTLEKERESKKWPPVRLILADWLSINAALQEDNSKKVKASRYLNKLFDLICNGREFDVCVWADLQSYNLDAIGMKADKNSRKNFNIVCLGNQVREKNGGITQSYGILENLIGDSYIISDDRDRTRLQTDFRTLKQRSIELGRPIFYSSVVPEGSDREEIFITPDLTQYKAGAITQEQSIADLVQKAVAEALKNYQNNVSGSKMYPDTSQIPDTSDISADTFQIHCNTSVSADLDANVSEYLDVSGYKNAGENETFSPENTPEFTSEMYLDTDTQIPDTSQISKPKPLFDVPEILEKLRIYDASPNKNSVPSFVKNCLRFTSGPKYRQGVEAVTMLIRAVADSEPELAEKYAVEIWNDEDDEN